MEFYFLRHAHASHRQPGSRDVYRQLSELGHQQAEGVRTFLSGKPVSMILSSPATRCVQTVLPLAAAAGLEIFERPALWEDATAADTVELLNATAATLQTTTPQTQRRDEDDTQIVVVCSHGNIIPETIELLMLEGLSVEGHGCEQASIWVLSRTDARWTQARYLRPPDY